jgi:MarR family transcriptional regulator for hemolysin
MARGLRYDFDASLGFWVVPAAHALERALNEELAPLGVTYRQWQVLACLIYDPAVTQAALARLLGVEAPTLKGIVDRMERDGWVRRVPCPEDRRCNRLELQAAVEPLWRRMAACARRVRVRAMRGMTPGQFEVLKRALGSVRANLEKTEEVRR